MTNQQAIMPLLRRKPPISKEQLEELYLRDRLSMSEIGERLSCSVHKVQYWMQRHQITRRHWDEASYVKHNPDGDPFKIKEPQTEDDRDLFTLGIGLYIGEGTKHRQQVRLANTDPQVIRAFLRFLRETCGVEEQRISAWLNVFDDVDLEEALAYWQRVTGLPRSQFYEATVRRSRGGNYHHKSRFGTLTVGVSNTKLSDKISGWCENLLQKFSS